ncbi:MAG: cell division protein ZapA [Candidatus Sumerlaeia bacterium]|nr:cell division protein ZapA [Candidatus Sumerlaeia bacterium]
MKVQKEQIALSLGGHEVHLELLPSERPSVEKTAKAVATRIQELTSKAPSAPQAKIATMVAFEFACQLAEAEALLEEAEKLRAELARQKLAVQRLESLLEKVDSVLV